MDDAGHPNVTRPIRGLSATASRVPPAASGKTLNWTGWAAVASTNPIKPIRTAKPIDTPPTDDTASVERMRPNTTALSEMAMYKWKLRMPL
jgi:hypothetical protein